MFEMGFVVGLGLLITMVKASWRIKMALVSNPIAVDFAVFILLSILHWGTFSGMMVATIGALTVSVMLSGYRKLFGHIKNGLYYRGIWDVSAKIKQPAAPGIPVAA